jgi:hypothetical protein
LDDAYRLSRRNYRQKGDEESLMSALGNLRAYALLPALGVYGSFAALAGGDPAALNRAKQQLGSKLPAYLRAFFTLEGSGKPSRVLGSGGAVPDNGLPAQKAGLVLDATKKTFWVYRRSAGNAVVAEFGTSLAGQENTIMADLRKNRMLEQPWKLFADLQIRSGARLLGELCAIVLYEQQRLKGGKIDFSGLESGLRENPAVLYVALYDKKGALLQSSGFDMSRCSADHVLWRKSTTTPAYLVQDVEYATIPALDVAAPVPGLRGGIVGVVKIGLKKQ